MKKKFDAVQFQREARAKLAKEYLKNRKKFIAGLKHKYRIEEKKAARFILANLPTGGAPRPGHFHS